jgi:hypothetical protein
VEAYNREAAKKGNKPLVTAQEVADGRTYYTLAAADAGPLLEAHYTFSDGYLIAGPSRALIARAIQVKAAGTSIARAAKFQEMAPRDHYADFSAVIYQNLGTTLAPLAGLLGGLASGNPEAQSALQNLGSLKPMFIAAYGEPDRITVATTGDVMGMNLPAMMTGNLLGIAGTLPGGAMMPFHGTRPRQPAY